MHYEYPDLDPHVKEAIPVLKDAFLNRPVNPKAATHAGYVMLGYGLSIMPGAPTEHGSQYDERRAVEDLERLEGGGANAAIPWGALIMLIIEQIIKKYFNQVA